MQKSPILVPQRPSSEIYELVKNRLLHTEFKWLPKEEIKKKMHKVNTTYRIAKEAHYGQERDGWEDYFKNHIIPVLEIYLNELRWTSLEWVLSAILHDAPEDCEEIVDLNVIRKLIWEQVAINVDFLTKPGYAQYLSDDQRAVYDELDEQWKKEYIKSQKHILAPILVKQYFAKMQSGANDDTVRVKVADRLHNLRTLPDDIKRIDKYIKETEEYIMPILAEREMKREIELINRELIKLKIRLLNLSNQESLKETLESQQK